MAIPASVLFTPHAEARGVGGFGLWMEGWRSVAVVRAPIHSPPPIHQFHRNHYFNNRFAMFSVFFLRKPYKNKGFLDMFSFFLFFYICQFFPQVSGSVLVRGYLSLRLVGKTGKMEKKNGKNGMPRKRSTKV